MEIVRRFFPVLIVLLLASMACRLEGTLPSPNVQSDSATQTLQPTVSISDGTDAQEPISLCREVLPNETNPAISQWNEAHIVCTPPEANARGELFVFLPGTGATPDYYTYLMQAAAEAGLHAIGLRYPNDRSANIQICPRDSDPDCHEKLREEITQGHDVSKNVSVDEINSIEGRLLSALTYLESQSPEAGWAQFLDDGAIQWDAIVIAGHSQGGGHAVYLAYEHRVQHAIAFAWVDVRKGELAPWLVNNPSQTPPEDYYLFWHEKDEVVAKYQAVLKTALGIDPFGATAVVDGATPPYGGSHALMATYPAPQGERAHNTHVADMALVFAENGEPIYKATWQYLLTLDAQAIINTTLPEQVVTSGNSVRMGDTHHSYIDPEFYTAGNLVTFADEQRNAWLSALDPQTGDFSSPTGRDIFIDDQLTPLVVSFNAPEFGFDQDGWALYYTKDSGGVPQIWRAEVDGSEVITEVLTHDQTTRLSVLASKDPALETTRLLYAYGGFSPDEGKVAWLDESDPQSSETIVGPIDRGARWVDGTAFFVYVESGQVVLQDTQTGTVKTVAGSEGVKSYAYGWIAPETGELMILTLVDDSRIEVYSLEDGETSLYSSLGIPEASDYRIIGSPETFTAGGKSYITLVVKESKNYARAEVWVWGIEEDPKRFILRCEDGRGEVIRTDPEAYAGEDEVFVYYNLVAGSLSEGQFELYRCSTGLKP